MRHLLLLALLAAVPTVARAQYVTEPPAAGTLQGIGALPQPGSSLAGPPSLEVSPVLPPVPFALPSAGIADSTIPPLGAGGLPVARVPLAQLPFGR